MINKLLELDDDYDIIFNEEDFEEDPDLYEDVDWI